jgi:hypothetical protein
MIAHIGSGYAPKEEEEEEEEEEEIGSSIIINNNKSTERNRSHSEMTSDFGSRVRSFEFQVDKWTKERH